MQIKSQDSALQAKSMESAELSKPYGPPAGSNGFRPASPMIATAVDALSEAMPELAGFRAQFRERVAAARQSVDGYVIAHPWRALGIGAAIGIVLGVLFARRT
jgi:ElaB/YqjD/DUF883 family membrane-anchored ribosome-binding protein